jgi:hypothetical protein
MKELFRFCKKKKKKKSLSKRLLAFIGLTRQDNTMCHNPILDFPQNYLILLKIKRNWKNEKEQKNKKKKRKWIKTGNVAKTV